MSTERHHQHWQHWQRWNYRQHWQHCQHRQHWLQWQRSAGRGSHDLRTDLPTVHITFPVFRWKELNLSPTSAVFISMVFILHQPDQRCHSLGYWWVAVKIQTFTYEFIVIHTVPSPPLPIVKHYAVISSTWLIKCPVAVGGYWHI